MTIDSSNMNVPSINSKDQKPRLTLEKAFKQAARESDILKKMPPEMQKDVLAAAQYYLLNSKES